MAIINLQFSFLEFISKVRAIKNPYDCEDLSGFYGTKSLAAALDIMDKGFIPDGGFDAFDVPPSEYEVQTVSWDVVGSVPDIGVYLSGMPLNMIEATPSLEQKRFVKLAVQVNCNAGYDADDMQRFNNQVYHAITSLKAQGVEIELSALLYNRVGSGTECLLVDILKQGEVFNPSMLSAAMHVSFFRRIWFAWTNEVYKDFGASRSAPEVVGDGYHTIPNIEFQSSDFDLKDFILGCVAKDEENRLQQA